MAFDFFREGVPETARPLCLGRLGDMQASRHTCRYFLVQCIQGVAFGYSILLALSSFVLNIHSVLHGTKDGLQKSHSVLHGTKYSNQWSHTNRMEQNTARNKPFHFCMEQKTVINGLIQIAWNNII